MKLLIFSLFVSFVVCRTVTAQIRNEFQTPLTLVSATLFSGQFAIKPPTSVPVSTTYATLFLAEGESTGGVVHYSAENNFANVYLHWQNAEGNQTYTMKVGPSPFIGGVGVISGKINQTIPYWLHEMCSEFDNGICRN